MLGFSMFIAIFVAQPQTGPPSQPLIIQFGSTPATMEKQPPPKASDVTPQIANRTTNTTPDLDLTTQMTHAQMEHDIGGEQEAIGELKSNVSEVKEDVKGISGDVAGLKTSRSYFIWITTGISGAALLLWSLRKTIWNDTIRPRLLKALTDPAEL